MMKLVFLAAVFIALVQPSVQVTCYECKSPLVASSHTDFNDARFQLCEGDQKNWKTRNTTLQGFDKCKKIVEKINVNNKEEKLIIRTIGIADMGLDKTKFEEYTCNENLCNSAVSIYATAFAVVLSMVAALWTHL